MLITVPGTSGTTEPPREVAPRAPARRPGCAALAAALFVASTARAAGEELPPPQALRVEYARDPLGLDTPTPRFFWRLGDPRRGALQGAYRIAVATSLERLEAGDPDLWDSGKVRSGHSTHVVYRGRPLASRERCFWKVRTWDPAGRPSRWSPPARFEMGLLEPSDWTARWIGAPADLVPQGELPWGSWIWPDGSGTQSDESDAVSRATSGEPARAFFRLAFTVPEGDPPCSALLQITADDGFQLFVNGASAGQGSRWTQPQLYDVKPFLKEGRNVIALLVENRSGPAGLLAGGRLELLRGGGVELVTDRSWKASAVPAPGWQEPDFDDSLWSAAEAVAPAGDPPWGTVRPLPRPRRSLALRREIHLEGRPVRARLYASGLGLYEIAINGERVGRQVLAPGWTHYLERVQYQTYDVTGLLGPGANVVSAVLGNGWWSGGLGWNREARYGDARLRLLLQLEVETAGGGRQVFTTGPGWSVRPSPVVADSLYDGERYDARLELPGWHRPGLQGAALAEAIVVPAPPARLVAQEAPPIEPHEEIPARAIRHLGAGHAIIDFGQNLAGWVRLRVEGPRGTEVELRFAESLGPDGRLDTRPYRGARATDHYVLAGSGVETWEPRFTYRGFRYVEVRGYPGTPRAGDFLAVAVHSACEAAGRFESSSPLLNRLFQNVLWTQRSSLHSVPTSCPDRDERFAWLGEAQLFAPAACFNRNMALFYEKWMRDIRGAQKSDGSVPDTAPAVAGGTGTPGWADAVVIIPWIVYRRYGNRRIVEENYEAMRAWVECMRRRAPEDLFEGDGYGDCLAPVPSPAGPVGTAYYFLSADLLARMAKITGRLDDAEEYSALARRIAAAFNRRTLDPATHTYAGGTQTANLLPLHFGITPRQERARVAAAVAGDIVRRGGRLATGYLGTAALLEVLAGDGYQDLAYQVVTQPTPPSWGAMVASGATTIWESWEAGLSGDAATSRNHPALGVVSRWLAEDVAGLRPDPDVPGYKRVLVRPRPPAGLEWARASYESLHGPIESAWRQEPDGFRLDLSLPANTVGAVYVPHGAEEHAVVEEGGRTLLRGGEATGEESAGVFFLAIAGPDAVFQVGAGEYHFRVRGAAAAVERPAASAGEELLWTR